MGEAWLLLLLWEEVFWWLWPAEDRQGADTPWLGPRRDWGEPVEQQGNPGHREEVVCLEQAEDIL